MIKQVDEITFPKLEEYLSSRYTFSVGKMTCEFCNYVAKNQQALSAHYRGCAIKKLKTTPSEESISDEAVKTEPIAPEQTLIKIKKQVKPKTNIIVTN
jgi:hypothetical protein